MNPTKSLSAGTEQLESGVIGFESLQAQRECERIRNQIKSDLASAVADSENLMLGQELKAWNQGLTDRALEEAGFDTPEKKAKALRENIPWVQQNIKEAKQFGHWFKSEIEQARRSGALTEENARNARAMALNRSGDWTTVKAFFTKDGSDSFKGWLSNWRYMADLLKKIDAQQKKHKIPDDALLALKQLKSGSGKFEFRMALAEKTLASLTHLEGKNQHVHRDAKALLMQAVGAKALAYGKVDGWLAHIFTKYKGDKAAAFVENTLPSFIEDWKEVADSYRHLGKELTKKGVKPMDEAKFLSLGFKEREREVTQMRSMLSGDTVEKEQTKEVDYLKMRIRFNLASKDFETAEDLLQKLERNHPKDKDVKSFRAELKKGQQSVTKKVVGKHPQEKAPLPELLGKIHGFLQQVEDLTMRNLLEDALVTQDLDVLEGMMQMIYNRYWCRIHGYLNDKIEQTEVKKESNKEKTLQYAENGHSKTIERNIIQGETAKKESIRGGKVNKAQLLYISNEASAREATVQRIKENKYTKNAGLRYWGTIVTMGGSSSVNEYGSTKYFVESLYYPMRSVIRQYFRAGGQYRRQGSALPSIDKGASEKKAA